MSIFHLFEQYEKRFLQSMLDKTSKKMWTEEDRKLVLSIVKNSLGIKDNLLPKIDAKVVRELNQDGFGINFLTAQTWKNVIGTAHLYVPYNMDTKKNPFVILCCGHGKDCKLNLGYQAMARRLVRQGAIVLITDNIGQGERVSMGHANAVAPFACGLSVQGLIVMETMAWFEWAKNNLNIDTNKTAAIGNSGGGTLSMFLGALCSDISVVAPSGYPSSFDYIARKEKKHCHCNIIPGIVGKAEMWEVLGLVAPRPLYISQGQEDNFFPVDIFNVTVRKVKSVYEQFEKEDNFYYKTFHSGHSWNNEKRYELSKYLADKLGLEPAAYIDDDTVDCLDSSYKCLEDWPEYALTIDELSAALTGVNTNAELRLYDVYPPKGGADIVSDKDVKQIFAQFEAFLGDGD